MSHFEKLTKSHARKMRIQVHRHRLSVKKRLQVVSRLKNVFSYTGAAASSSTSKKMSFKKSKYTRGNIFPLDSTLHSSPTSSSVSALESLENVLMSLKDRTHSELLHDTEFQFALKNAALGGSFLAAFNLGVLLITQKNFKEALFWFGISSKSPNAEIANDSVANIMELLKMFGYKL